MVIRGAEVGGTQIVHVSKDREDKRAMEKLPICGVCATNGEEELGTLISRRWATTRSVNAPDCPFCYMLGASSEY